MDENENNKFLPKLSQNLLEILDDDEYYDIIIEVGKDPYVKTFRAHMVILNYRSPYLKRILSTNKKKNDDNYDDLIQIKLPNILPEIFQIILRYIYGGKLSLDQYDTSDIIKILIAANELNLQELISHLQSSLIKNQTNWMEQNFNLVYKMSFENDSFSELQKYCTDLISNDPDKIFNSSNFSSIPEKILVTLIQSENLQMSEVQIWENVLKWGFAQNPDLPSDPTKFSKDNFSILKNTLQQCIPFIKFTNLTSREFLDNVFPYREILPEELYIDLLKLFLDNDHKPVAKQFELTSAEEFDSKGFNSRIITPEHVELISRWIDKLDITDDNESTSSYEFKLILRGSRDGFSLEKFYEICVDKSHTVTVIKVKDSNEILGGYNPTEWKFNYGFSNTKNSFIFSFKDESYSLSRVMNESFAILNNLNCGPSFGNGDLILSGNESYNTSYCKKNSYEKLIREREGRFLVEEYEIFQITSIK